MHGYVLCAVRMCACARVCLCVSYLCSSYAPPRNMRVSHAPPWCICVCVCVCVCAQARIETQLRLKNDSWWLAELVNSTQEGGRETESMKLLKNILPESIIERMQQGQKFVADSHQHVVILFSGRTVCVCVCVCVCVHCILYHTDLCVCKASMALDCQ